MPAHSLPRAARAALICSVLLFAAGCAGDAQDWRGAQAADTQEAYEAFAAKHPESEFAAQAKERASQLQEQRDWEISTQADTVESYTKFLQQHPKGKWAQEARVRIENFNVMGPVPTPEPVAPPAAAPKPATAPKPAIAPKPATAPKPVAAPRPAAPSEPSGAVSHRIQLGAFSSRAKADSEWQRLRGRHTVLKGLASRVTEVQTPSGLLYRLQASVASEARAKEICAELKAKDQPCLYVPP